MNQDKSSPAHQTNAKALARRRLIKGSLTAPVAMTLFSNPVSAGTCLNASAFASTNTFLSRQAAGSTAGVCDARAPATWASTPLSSWPTSCVKTETDDGQTKYKSKKFKDIFARQNTVGEDDTLLTVLGYTDTSGKKALARRIVALHLNCEAGRTGALLKFTTDDIRKVWNDICTLGEYAPNGTTKLDADKVNAWLDRMWT